MILEPIGVATIFVGLFCVLLGDMTMVTVLAIVPVLGSAAAMFVGFANIQPAHVLLGFLALGVITRKQELRAFIRALSPGEPGFWFVLLIAYGVLSAYFAPRLLTGVTQIVALGSTVFGDTGSTVPLVPVSSNLTQSVYMIGNLVCFGLTLAVASTHRGFNAVLTGLIGYCVANIAFAVLDMATFATGTQWLLDFMRNAQYALHTDAQIGGLKRIVGSFTEASSFARSTLGVLAFSGTLWLAGYRRALMGSIAAASVVLLFLSTSSTGVAGAPLMLLILYATAFSLSGRRRIRRVTAAAMIMVPLAMIAVALLIAIDPVISKTVYEYVDIVVLGKATSDSGIERSTWNTIAMQNFFDSWGFGVGLGTVRTSSFVMALLANVGIPGTIFYAAFAYTAFFKKRGVPGTLTSDVRLAARNGCFGLTIGDLLVSPVLDQGLFFCMLAAVCCAQPERERSTQAVRAATQLGATA